MNKDLEKWVIFGCILIILMIGISGCGTTKTSKTNETPNINVYNGTVSTMLGCIFKPSECEKFKKEESTDDLQDEITEEMMEMDSEAEKTNN